MLAFTLTYIPPDKVGKTDRRKDFIVESHPAVLDGFINQARSAYQTLNLWGYTDCHTTDELDFEGKVMVLDPTNLKDEHKNPKNQLILCDSGFGCTPNARGRKVFGRFLIDNERCQYERSDFMGQLKDELLSGWAKDKLKEMGIEEQTPKMGGMEMK